MNHNQLNISGKMRITCSALFILNFIYCSLGIDPLVLTSRGLIKGLKAEDGNYTMFLGIPYAIVDKKNAFGNSRPHPSFKGPYKAYSDSTICPQLVQGTITGTLDCLRLNIYVPDVANRLNKIPVMLYIHGGTFVLGSGKKDSFNPNFLLKHDVIIVTMNYRVGPYGFLCVSDPEYNNQGIRDQIIAIKWVKDNIAAFGGDVSKITVFGQSAGAMTLDILLLGLKDKLFTRAIIQSGPAVSPWVVTSENDSVVLRIAKYLGMVCNNVTNAIDYLTMLSPNDVIKAAYELNITNFKGHPMTKPCVQTDGESKILEDYPINLLPKVKGLDIMIGHTSREVMFMYPKSDDEFYKNYKFSDELVKGFEEVRDVDTIKQFYLGDKFDKQREILDFGSDFVFSYPVERTVDRYLEGGANKVYRYIFAYEGGRNLMKTSKNLTEEGASHGDDLGYLFDYDIFEEKPSQEDQAMIDRMTEMWTNFAKYGDPTPVVTELIPVKWEPVNNEIEHYMIIDSPLAVGKRPLNHRMAFWKLYYKLNGQMERR